MLRRFRERLNAAAGRGRRCWFWAAVVVLLGAMGAAQVTSALQETQIWDEAIHIAAGYSYLKTGDYRLNREHPPLAKLLSGAMLLPLDPELPLDSEAWKKADGVEFGDLFLYKNRVDPETMLFRARAAIMALTLALGLALALWTRQKFGPAAGIAALFLFAFDPNLIAHGHYVTSDVAATAFIFLATLAWERYLQTQRRRDLVVSGIVLGLALISKFSAIFLVPVLAVLYWLRRWQLGPGRLSLRRFAAATATVGAISIAVIALAYGPESIRCWSGPKLRQVVDPSTLIGKVLFQTGKRLGLPAHPYLAGISDLAFHNKVGHEAYLMGMQSREGWWYYFPVVFAVKTSLSVIALLVLSIAIALRPANPRKIPFHWIVLLLPPLVYFAFCMGSNINIGVRHLLPIYPFLYAAIAGAIAGAARLAHPLRRADAGAGYRIRLDPPSLPGVFQRRRRRSGERAQLPCGFQSRLGAGPQESQELSRPEWLRQGLHLLFRTLQHGVLPVRVYRSAQNRRTETAGRSRLHRRHQRHVPARRLRRQERV